MLNLVRITKLLPALLALCLLSLPAGPVRAQKNECLKCHTSGPQLIKLTAALHKNDPKKESLSEGPG